MRSARTWALATSAGLTTVAAAQGTPLAALPPGLLDQGLALMQQAAAALAPRAARITVTAGALDSRLKLAPCAAGTASLVVGMPAWGASRLGLRCTQGANWSIQVPVRVQAFAPAVVTASALSAGTTLSGTLLAVAEVDWAAHGPPARGQAALFNQAHQLDSRQLARPLAAGAPVRAADLQARQWFAAGATVSVVAVGDGFSVAAEGQALSPGLEGLLVRVRTESGRVLTGQATAERRVEVRQ